jgi:ABC-type multidrug transport system fused ATPase/permease subunit
MGMRGHGGPRALASQRPKRSRPIRVLLGRMVNYLGRFKRIVAIGAVLSLAATIVSVFDPLVLSWAIDSVLVTSPVINTILFLTALYVLFRVTSWILNSVNVWILAGAQAGFVQTIQEDLYTNLLGADLSYHKSEQSGNVTARVTSDTVELGTGVQVLIDFSSQALMLVSSFLMLWWVNPFIALTTLVVLPGVAFIALLFGSVGQRIMLASRRASGAVSGQIAENLSGIHVAKAFNREKELAEEMMELNQNSYHHGFRMMILMSAMQPLVRTIGQLALSAMLFVAGSLAVGAFPMLTIGELFLGITLINRFLWPLLGLSMMFTQVQTSMAAMDRVMDVIESKPAISDAPDAEILAEDSDGIYFQDVTFEYVEDTPVLNGVNFSIEPGEMVAIVGHTGAGKTTIAALVNRFYDPTEGGIFIGGQDLRLVTQESLHNSMSLIPQEPYLFDDSIFENIRYGRPEATDEEIYEICKIIGANEFIEVLADGYDTVIIEGGKNLSAGQRQMITIARTMLANPKILILDEATSRLDAYSESLVQDAQERLFSNRTTIVIAHRLTTIANASRVFVFDHGDLVEEGTHEELLALNGVFKSLYDTYYAHQGIDEITEEVAEVAKSEVKKHGVVGETPTPSGPGMMMMGMGGGMGDMHGGMGGDMGGMKPSPEMIEKIKERYKSDPDSIPAPMREMIEKMIAAEGIPDAKKKKLGKAEMIGHSGPAGSGRPSPEMIEKMKEQYKSDPDSIPPNIRVMLERMIEAEEMKDDKKEYVGKQETIGHSGPIGSGRPTPEMIEKLKEQYRTNPDSLPPNVREMIARRIAEDDEAEG